MDRSSFHGHQHAQPNHRSAIHGSANNRAANHRGPDDSGPNHRCAKHRPADNNSINDGRACYRCAQYHPADHCGPGNRLTDHGWPRSHANRPDHDRSVNLYLGPDFHTDLAGKLAADRPADDRGVPGSTAGSGRYGRAGPAGRFNHHRSTDRPARSGDLARRPYRA